MRLLHGLARTHASFDDPDLVSRAGLVPVMALPPTVPARFRRSTTTPRSIPAGRRPGSGSRPRVGFHSSRVRDHFRFFKEITMALPREIGSVNDELRLGATDGTYKQVVKDRGGVVETATYEHRRDLSVAVYGIVELADKELPAEMGTFRSPYAVKTPSPGILVSQGAA
jgi:hypothetical protein